ncbi:MAG: hypothetical protein AAB693_00290 [Patescibacteria group bacterium]
MRKLSGGSVKLCIKDIIDSKVRIDEVIEIYDDMKSKTLKESLEIIDVYKKTTWASNPEYGWKIFQELASCGKIKSMDNCPSPSLLKNRLWIEFQKFLPGFRLKQEHRISQVRDIFFFFFNRRKVV